MMVDPLWQGHIIMKNGIQDVNVNEHGHEHGHTKEVTTTNTTDDEIKKVVLQSSLSPLCNPTLPPEHTPIKRIVFGHMRKAGGTTIMKYLKKVKKVYNLKLVSYEAGCIERPGTRNDTLYITHIRNPVERAVTNFKYSERWDCRCLVGNQKRCPPTWKPTEENAKSMKEWLKQGDKCWKGMLYDCNSNCFIKWLNHQNDGHDICADKPGTHHSVNSSHYQSALGTAKKFHLIIQTEKLRDEEYVESLENYFGVASTFTQKKIPMYCDKQSKAANIAYPHNMTDTARTLLIGMNTEDNHFFKELSTCPDGIRFPKGSLGDIAHSKKPNVEGELKAKQVGNNNARASKIGSNKIPSTEQTITSNANEVGIDDEDHHNVSASSFSSSHKPRFIFGHSTGHAGSSSVMSALKDAKGCPWHLTSRFERHHPVERSSYHNKQLTDTNDLDCGIFDNKVLPMFSKLIEREAKKLNVEKRDMTYLDMGHFHNRFRTLECLADRLGEQLTFVKVRRNRYAIANSFASSFITPCMSSPQSKWLNPNITEDKTLHPALTICPRSDELIGVMNLPVPDEIWDRMTPFQRFLWYADEMEHRWHTLTSTYNSSGTSYHEINWSHSKELEEGIVALGSKFGCESVTIENKKQHVKHVDKMLNCSDFIRQDLEYRNMVNYDDETLKILVPPTFSQHVNMDDCMDSRIELEEAIKVYSVGSNENSDINAWVLPEQN